MTPAYIEALKAWYIFSFSLGAWTCLTLVFSRRGQPGIRYTMLAFVALLLMPSLNSYVTLLNQYPVYWLFALSHDLTWGWGPIVVILIQKILLQKHRPLILLLHATPFIVSATALLLKHPIVNTMYFLAAIHIQVFSYLIYTIFLLTKNRSKILSLVTQHQNTTYYWLVYLVAGLIFIMLVDSIAIAGVYVGIFKFSILASTVATVLALYVNTIALFAVYQPEVFFHAPKTIEEEFEKKLTNGLAQGAEEKPQTDVQPVAARYTELSPEAAEQLNEQLQHLIDTHKPHLDETISLIKLASLLDITTHQLSELLNAHNETNFYDFLNNLRHQEALKLLHNPDIDLTIADIAYQAGFNNRTTFYHVFKEKTGVTPKQYKKAMA